MQMDIYQTFSGLSRKKYSKKRKKEEVLTYTSSFDTVCAINKIFERG
jgi:hypothetical protein